MTLDDWERMKLPLEETHEVYGNHVASDNSPNDIQDPMELAYGEDSVVESETSKLLVKVPNM